MVLSGGSEDIEWKYVDAIKTLYKSTNMKYSEGQEQISNWVNENLVNEKLTKSYLKTL